MRTASLAFGLLVSVSPPAGFALNASRQENFMEIRNDRVKLMLVRQNGALRETYFAKHGKEEQVAHLDAVTGRHVLCKVITLRQGEPFARIQISYRIEVRTKLQH